MAENAANFTQTLQNRPSIFEILAQKSLNDTLYPALQKVALFLSSNFPRKFGFLNFYYDEAFLTVNGLLQLYYLAYYNSSFSENFYGLKRALSDSRGLTNRDKELSLIFLVALPYFKRKIDDKIQIYRIENAEGHLRKDFEGRSKQLLIHTYAAYEVIYGLISIYNYLRYMSNKSQFQLPILKLLGLKLVYANEEPGISFWGALLQGTLRFSDFNFSLVRNALSTVLETTAFFMQFLQMWNDQNPGFHLADLPKVDPPTKDNAVAANSLKGKCPLCFNSWTIPAVLPVSGYIFCFSCILRYLNECHKCPVTNLPARPLDIVRLYTDN